jgi:hypothetical protein
MPTYELRIELNKAQPPIWRTFLVPSDIPLDDLHNVIQMVMGWTNSHLHEFVRGNIRYGVPDSEGDDFGQEAEDESDFTLDDLLTKPKHRLTYTYDFGDNWQHTLTLLAIRPEECTTIRCLAGERAGPPDDCGGVYGYEQLLETLSDPKAEDHEEMKEWFASMTPENHDPEVFPLAAVNEQLAQGVEALAEAMWADDEDDFLDELLPPDPKFIQFPGTKGVAWDEPPPSKIGRNDPCPCGSGKKYKKCCGK